jgi:hypothetical protein
MSKEIFANIKLQIFSYILHLLISQNTPFNKSTQTLTYLPKKNRSDITKLQKTLNIQKTFAPYLKSIKNSCKKCAIQLPLTQLLISGPFTYGPQTSYPHSSPTHFDHEFKCQFRELPETIKSH